MTSDEEQRIDDILKREGTTHAADVLGVLQEFLPHISEIGSALLEWQKTKFLETRKDLIAAGLSTQDATHVALELVRSNQGAIGQPAQALPFGSAGGMV